MVRIIITTVLVVLLAVLVAFNLTFTTSFSLFGLQFAGVPVMAVALVSFALGVAYSVFLYVGRYLRRRTKLRLEQRHKDVAQREQLLAGHESDAKPPAGDVARSPAGDGVPSMPARKGRWRPFQRRQPKD